MAQVNGVLLMDLILIKIALGQDCVLVVSVVSMVNTTNVSATSERAAKNVPPVNAPSALTVTPSITKANV